MWESKKGKEKRIIITGVRDSLEELGETVDGNKRVEERKVRIIKKIYGIVTVYNGRGMVVIKSDLEEIIQEQGEGSLLLGDIYARIGRNRELYIVEERTSRES